jgi:hypothetical protein
MKGLNLADRNAMTVLTVLKTTNLASMGRLGRTRRRLSPQYGTLRIRETSVLSLKNVTITELLLSYMNGASDFAAAGNRRGAG